MNAPSYTALAPFEVAAPSRKLWVFAAIVALAFHAGIGGFILLKLDQEPDDSDLGAPALAIGIDLASPSAEPSNLPPGPESEASAASQAAAEQRLATEQPDLPKEKPTESESADRLVTENDAKAPTEETPEIAVKQVAPAEESVAQEATAAPSVQTPVEAPQSVTVDQGIGVSRQRARLTWQRELMAHLDRFKRYPAERLQRNAEIIVNLVLDRTGRVITASVAQSSGNAASDEAAVAMVQRASPVPMPPPLVADEGLAFKLPVTFRSARGS